LKDLYPVTETQAAPSCDISSHHQDDISFMTAITATENTQFLMEMPTVRSHEGGGFEMNHPDTSIKKKPKQLTHCQTKSGHFKAPQACHFAL